MWFHPHFRRPVGLYFSPTLNSMYDPAVTGLLQESYDPFMGESRDHFTTPCHWYIGTQCGPSSVGYFNIRPWDLHYSWESWYSYKSQNLSLRILCIIYTIIDPAHLPPMSFWGALAGGGWQIQKHDVGYAWIPQCLKLHSHHSGPHNLQ